MCKASLEAIMTSDAEDGKTYAIGKSNHGLGAFHVPGRTASECVICVKGGTILTLIQIPPGLRKKHHLGETERVRFDETGDNAHDFVEFLDNDVKPLPLVVFADQGILATVGEIEQVGDKHKIKDGPAMLTTTDVLRTHDGNRRNG